MRPTLLALLAILALLTAHANVNAKAAESDPSAAAATSGIETDAFDDETNAAAEKQVTVSADPSLLELVPFVPADFFTGEWDVYRHVLTPTGGIDLAHSLPAVRWQLLKDNTTATSDGATTTLIGHGYINGSNAGEADSWTSLRVEFPDPTNPSSGRFQTGPDEDSLITLFHFQFQQLKAVASSGAQLALSTGWWMEGGAQEGQVAYTLQVPMPDRFTILVTPKTFDLGQAQKQREQARQTKTAKTGKKSAADEEDEEDDSLHGDVVASTSHPSLPSSALSNGRHSILYTAYRVKYESDKSWFQRYGTMIMLAAMLCLNIFMRTRQQSGLQRTQRNLELAAQRAQQRGAAAAAGSGSSTTKIQDISDGSKKDK